MGPLAGFKIIEIAGIGPAPFGAMLLADLGAEVIRVERPGGGLFGGAGQTNLDLLNRGKRCICVDLKKPGGVDVVLRLLEGADGLVEGFRPGVMEKLGLGPDVCLARNPRLVYGRMTGWGQEGPLAQRAGHDINYISLAGALHPIGRAGEKPAIPLNLVGDFGGGGLLLAFGVVSALLECSRSGRGQVVDAAMIDGSATLMTSVFAAFQSGFWSDRRGTNMLDSGSHFYEVYETADGRYVAIGAIESQFYAQLLDKLGLADDPDLPQQFDMARWPELKQRFAEIFRGRSRDEWCEIFEGSDACFAPVLSLVEVKDHPHHRARESFIEADGAWQPAPAPRFGRTPAAIQQPPASLGEHTGRVLREAGFDDGELRALHEAGAVAGQLD